MTQAEVEAKALDLIAPVLGAARARAILRSDREAGNQCPMLRRCAVSGSRPKAQEHDRMTLLLSNEDVETALSMPDCLDAMEIAYRDLGFEAGRQRRPFRDTDAHVARGCALFAPDHERRLAPRFGIGAVRINSDILTWPELPSGRRRVKIPAAPNGALFRLGAAVQHADGRAAGDLSRRRRAAHAGRRHQRLGREISRPQRCARGRAARHRLAGGRRRRWRSPLSATSNAFAATARSANGAKPLPRRCRRSSASRSLPPARRAKPCAGADIVLCATNSLQPVLAQEWLEPGMHVSSLSRLELGADVIRAADVIGRPCPRRRSKDCAHRRRRSGTGTGGAKIRAQQHDCANRAARTFRPAVGQSGRPPLEIATSRCFSTMPGLGYQFAATGHVIYTKARELGLGRALDTDLFTSALPS